MSASESAGVLMRLLLCFVFVASAAWKLVRAGEFGAAVSALSPQLSGRLREYRRVIAVLELVVAGLVVAPGVLAGFGLSAAGIALSLFTIFLWRGRDVSAGCGCWFSAKGTKSKRPYLVRNVALLLAVVTAAVLSPAAPAAMQALPLVPVGALLAAAALEMPALVDTIRHSR